jgi:hypothetical protein
MDRDDLDMLRRRSGLELTEDGQFLFHSQPVAHPRVQKLFHRGVEVRGDGQVVLRVGPQWCYLACRGVARFVTALSVKGDGLLVRVADGRSELVKSPRLAVDPGERFYLWVGNPPGPARLLRDAHQALAGLLESGEGSALELPVGQRRFPIRCLTGPPRADTAWPAG